jgi:hypothetical protein
VISNSTALVDTLVVNLSVMRESALKNKTSLESELARLSTLFGRPGTPSFQAAHDKQVVKLAEVTLSLDARDAVLKDRG